MALVSRKEGRKAVADASQHRGSAAAVSVGAVLEPEGVDDAVDRVEHEHDVRHFGHCAVLDRAPRPRS
jgi:hypothetical protein